MCVFNLFPCNCPSGITKEDCLFLKKAEQLDYSVPLPKADDIIYIPVNYALDKKTGTGIDMVQLQREACTECCKKYKEKTL